MRILQRALGRTVYWLTFPALWMILNNTERSRLIMVDGDKILVVKGLLGSGKWGLPGGGMHKDETPFESVIREVKEEIGLELAEKDLKHILSEPIKVMATKLKLHYFVASKPKGQTIKLQNFEIGEYAWIDPEKLNSHNANKDTLRAVVAYQENKT